MKTALAVVSLTLVNFGVLHGLSIVDEVSGTCCPPVARRQNSIPVHYVTGTHYEVGYSVGRTFGTIIKQFISAYEPLQSELLKMFALPEGRKIYEESLKSTEQYFPQYVIELKGMADGADVPFHELFLMALDDTLPKNLNTSSKDKGPVGCTSFIINNLNAQLLGHTEDAMSETVNNYYIISAHVVPGEDESGGLFAARDEKFEALAYAGHLPGYASGHNHHGLVFSINTIFVSKPLRGKIPREFITRALLASKANLTEIVDVLTNKGIGTADGFNVNFAFLDVPVKSRVFYTAEVTPKAEDNRSEVYLADFGIGRNSLHTNRLLHLKYPELNEAAYGSSVSRESRYRQMTKNRDATSLEDMIEILGNKEDDPWPIFSDKATARVSTIHLGIFDFIGKTWTMWTNDPINNAPLLQLPLTFRNFVNPIGNKVATNKVDAIGTIDEPDN
ncbi:uncharacterized protein LOC112692322 isoform X1 [Sipha flava]|uniref:Uncharacterized protein LOC112692322 isoform X1 n=1 Tax=Sipha flava TaxID=143950 RepID=A0A8B8GJU6_9HEMI|nr:uncharacterized protein LOC112692322 isoform X1 [Sipha flava]